MNKANYQSIATDIRKSVIRMHFLSKESHVGCALSCVDILTVLYFNILFVNPKKPFSDTRDRFILSKGHAVSALYGALSKKGFFPKSWLESFCQNESRLHGHSTMGLVPGVEVSTGSLGHGFPMGVGMALAGKRDKKKYRIFVLMSDGECDEGTTWESALFAAHHQLDNLTIIIDYNKLQGYGKTNEVLNLEPFKEKWMAFGWQAEEIDGHNFAEIEQSLSMLPVKKNKPTVIIAHTTKGKGVSFMENKMEWHYKNPNEEQYKLALKELDSRHI